MKRLPFAALLWAVLALAGCDCIEQTSPARTLSVHVPIQQQAALHSSLERFGQNNRMSKRLSNNGASGDFSLFLDRSDAGVHVFQSAEKDRIFIAILGRCGAPLKRPTVDQLAKALRDIVEQTPQASITQSTDGPMAP